MKKIISIILCAVMIAVILSVCVSAADRQEANGGFSITDIEVIGKTATAAIENSEACKLVAAIYDPDTGKMLASGITGVEKNAGSAQVNFDIPAMPDYFIVRAFALDGNMSALCAKYESRLYTKDFDDYRRVNFFVYESGNDEMTAFPGASVTSTDGFCDKDGDGKWDDRTALTGENGEAVFCFKPGSHTIKVTAQGYFEATKTFIVTESGETVDIKLIKNNSSGQEEPASDGTGSNDGRVDSRHLNFGSYPQTDVTASMGSVLDTKAENWKSYRYYSGSGTNASAYGEMTPGDYMLYCDVTYESEKYRGVTFSEYRPVTTGRHIVAETDSEQFKNGYTCGNIYWFKYEPVKWRIVNQQTGFMISDVILDSRPFSGFVKNVSGQYLNDKDGPANDWETSSLRAWLNDDFYRTAFTAAQQGQILAENGDKVFAMTEAQASSPVYFTNAFPRQVTGSDYAKCQGLKVFENGKSSWHLSSAGVSSLYACSAYYDGGIDETSAACITSVGVRPSIIISLPEHTASINAAKRAAQSTGMFGYSCAECEAGSDYILLNVTNYGDDFTLNASGLEYIDQITADANGGIYGNFIPRNNVPESVTLLIGKFGSGISAKIIRTEEEFVFTEFNIVNYQNSISVDYKSKLIFHTDTEAPEGYRIVWSTGAEGSTCTIDSAVNPEYTIKADIVRNSDNAVVKSTWVETVKVNTGFFARIIAFFRQIFKSLPVYENNRLK